MTIRISEPLVCILLGSEDGLKKKVGPPQEAIEAKGARVQSILIEAVADPTQLLCPGCLEAQEVTRVGLPLVEGICWACGEPYIGFRRSFKPLGFRWYSFNPF